MTHAICLECLAEKWGCYLPCEACGWAPDSAEARNLTHYFSDHMIPYEKFAEVREAMQAARESGKPFTLTREMTYAGEEDASPP